MRVLFQSDSYAVVELTQLDKQALGTGSSFGVVDTFYEKVPLLKNMVGTFVTAEEAEDWARDHE